MLARFQNLDQRKMGNSQKKSFKIEQHREKKFKIAKHFPFPFSKEIERTGGTWVQVNKEFSYFVIGFISFKKS